jgi:hypothetical protein
MLTSNAKDAHYMSLDNSLPIFAVLFVVPYIVGNIQEKVIVVEFRSILHRVSVVFMTKRVYKY